MFSWSSSNGLALQRILSRHAYKKWREKNAGISFVLPKTDKCTLSFWCRLYSSRPSDRFFDSTDDRFCRLSYNEKSIFVLKYSTFLFGHRKDPTTVVSDPFKYACKPCRNLVWWKQSTFAGKRNLTSNWWNNS